MNKRIIFLLLSLLFISGCNMQPRVSTEKPYNIAPYSLESIEFAYKEKVMNG